MLRIAHLKAVQIFSGSGGVDVGWIAVHQFPSREWKRAEKFQGVALLELETGPPSPETTIPPAESLPGAPSVHFWRCAIVDIPSPSTAIRGWFHGIPI